jgi:Tfp pilus assembly protein PilF
LVLVVLTFLAGCGGHHSGPIQGHNITQREVEIRLDLAEAYLRNNEPRLALQELNIIQPQAQAWPHFHFTLGYTQLLLGNGAEAADAFRRAVELDPGHGKAWNNLGLALLSLNQIEEAKKAFESTLAIPTHPTPEVTALNLAQLYTDSDQPDLALQYANLALELNWRFTDAYLLAAEIKLSRGKTEQAVALLEQGAEANPDDPRILLTLAEYLILAGQGSQALTWLDRLLNTAPNTPEAKIALKYKRSLKNGQTAF